MSEITRLAIYGKGGIGKSTICSNVAAALAERGLTVIQIGCDPKADSTIALRHGEPLPTVLETVRKHGDDWQLEDVVRVSDCGVVCVEAGGPLPGLGCAGRGIITALEKLDSKGMYDVYKPDVVIYDVLGDVVCGGFSMPMRSGYADKVYIITSGENMSIYAAANIAMAIDNFKGRGYATLGGLILNRRDVKNEADKAGVLASDIGTEITGDIPRSDVVTDSEELRKTVIEAFPQSEQAEIYRQLAAALIRQ